MANFSIDDLAWVRAFSYRQGLDLILNGSEAVTFYTTRGAANVKFVKSLAKLIHASHTLRAINLRGTALGCDGCQILCEAFKASNSLIVIILDECNLASRGAEAIAEVIEANPYLLCLNAFNNNFDLASLQQFEKALRRNNSLVKFNLSIIGPECTDTVIRIHSKLSKNQKKRKEAFFKAFRYVKNTEPWKRSRFMIVGQGRAGKTALVRSFHDMTFKDNWDSTIGAELKTSEITFGHSFVGYTGKSRNEYEHTKSLAGRLAVKGLQRIPFRRSTKITTTQKAARDPKKREPRKRGSFLTRVNFVQLLRPRRRRASGETLINRLDARELSNPELKNLPVDNKTLNKIHRGYTQDVFFKGTMENNENTFTCSVWDYGGQTVFYTLHHLFLTQHGVYIVCFSLPDMLSNTEQALTYLKFWLYSLKMHASEAPIFMVGTFFDEIEEGPLLVEVDVNLTKLVEEKFPLIQRNREEGLLYFPVSNKTGLGIVRLRESIIEVALQQEHVNFGISLSWTLLLDEIQKTGNHISLECIKRLAEVRGVSTKGEMEKLLSLFHQLGLIIHLKKTQVLAQTIVTNPQWLIDVLTRVLRDREIHSEFISDTVAKSGLKTDLERLYSEGLASRDLLFCLWEGEEAEFLIEIMKHAMLLAEWRYVDRTEAMLYVVPSLLHDVRSMDRENLTKPSHEAKKRGVPCIVDFSKNFLPHGVFERLICLLVDHSYTMNTGIQPQLASNWSRMHISDCTFLELQAVQMEDRIELFISNQLMASSFVMLISSMLFKLKQDVMENLSWEFQVFVEETERFIPYKEAVESQIDPWVGDTKQIRLSKELSTFDLKGFLGIAEEIFNNDEDECDEITSI